MKLIKEIFDRTHSSPHYSNVHYQVRKAARAIVLHPSKKMALLHVAKSGYYKLPGGGIEQGENIEQALRREVLEEVGVQIEIVDEVGLTIEYRNHINQLQLSYGYLAMVIGEVSTPSFTISEQDEGFKLVWVDIEEAMDLMKSHQPEQYFGAFIVERDLAFVEEALNLISNGFI